VQFYRANVKWFYLVAGGVGVVHMIQKIEHKEYMGFGNLCMYKVKY